MIKRIITTFAVAALVLVAGRSAFADTVYQLTTGNSAVSPPLYGSTYGTVTVSLTSSTTATITFQSDAGYLFTDGGSAAVNVNATSWTLSGLSASTLSDGGSGEEDGFGRYNQTLNNSDSYTDALSMIMFTLTDTSGMWADSGSVLTANNDGNFVAAHIGECNANPCSSSTAFTNTGFVAEAGATNIPTPEPSSLALLGTGVIGIAGIVRRKFRTPSGSGI